MLEVLFLASIVVFCSLSAFCCYLAARLGGDIVDLEQQIKRLERKQHDAEGVAP